MEKITSNNRIELFAKVKEVISFIEINYVKNDRYEVKGNINPLKGIGMMKTIQDLGIRDTKRLKRALNKVITKNSLRSVNTLLNFLTTRHVDSDVKLVEITEPKHIEIQKLKKEWKEAQMIAEQKLAQYKELKGDYYKVTEKELV